MLRKVYLEGEIGEKFGKEFEIEANSFSKVIQCLELNFPEFRNYLVDCAEKGINFTCQVADKPIEDERELFLQYEEEGTMTITALPAGSKTGMGKILAAVALIVVAIMLPGLAPGIYEGAVIGGLSWGEVISLTLLSMGISLGMAGIQQIMAPDPSVDNQQDESYLFQGSGQTIIEGDPVPILYGKLRVPGRPISFEVKNANQTFIDIAEGGLDYIGPTDSTSGGGSGGAGGNDAPTETARNEY
tara:strand:- start:4052 stop:4783 length:732 start_codon:yes stop_codon:yes gene_type:complete